MLDPKRINLSDATNTKTKWNFTSATKQDPHRRLWSPCAPRIAQEWPEHKREMVLRMGAKRHDPQRRLWSPCRPRAAKEWPTNNVSQTKMLAPKRVNLSDATNTKTKWNLTSATKQDPHRRNGLFAPQGLRKNGQSTKKEMVLQMRDKVRKGTIPSGDFGLLVAQGLRRNGQRTT